MLKASFSVFDPKRTSVLSRTELRDELSIETITSVYQNRPECPIAT